MNTLAPRSLVAFGTNSRPTYVGEVREPSWAEANGIKVEPGWAVVESSRTGGRYFVRVKENGQTVGRWGVQCPVVEMFNVETVVLGEGSEAAVWGVVGEPVNFGNTRCYTRPENVLVAV
jgi:hypothetical protein